MSKSKSKSKHQIQPARVEITTGLTRDGTAEPASLDQIILILRSYYEQV